MRSKRRFPIHPLLFAIYPILFLWAQNPDEASFTDVLKPGLISIFITLALIKLARWRTKDSTRADIAVSAFLIGFFSYGPFHWMLLGKRIGGFLFGRILVLYPLYSLVLILVIVLVVRSRRNLEPIRGFLSALSIVLVAITLVKIGVYQTDPSRKTVGAWNNYIRNSCSGSNALKIENKAKLPDIYYIILDNYSRADVLKQEIGFDNSAFINSLRKRGFYVADQSNSRYISTMVSLPASLNFDYLNTLDHEAHLLYTGKLARINMISNCRAAKLLRDAGYRMVSFPSGFAVTGKMRSDWVYTRSPFSATEFDRVLMANTMLMLPQALIPGNIFGSTSAVADYRNNINFTYDKLAGLPDIKEPKFAFAHILAAHPPFVFDANGNMPKASLDSLVVGNQLKRYDKKLYTDSILYLNKKTLHAVDCILTKSKTPPIIIVQADHGVSNWLAGLNLLSNRRRSAILNAYYLPNGGAKHLYPSIGPANTFRVIFNTYFGTHYKLLPDKYCRDYEKADASSSDNVPRR